MDIMINKIRAHSTTNFRNTNKTQENKFIHSGERYKKAENNLIRPEGRISSESTAKQEKQFHPQVGRPKPTASQNFTLPRGRLQHSNISKKYGEVFYQYSGKSQNAQNATTRSTVIKPNLKTSEPLQQFYNVQVSNSFAYF